MLVFSIGVDAVEATFFYGDSTSAATAWADLGKNLLEKERNAEIEPILREALAVLEKTIANDWQTFNSRSLLGGALAGQQKFGEAEPLLLSCG